MAGDSTSDQPSGGSYRLDGLAVPETLHELHGLLERVTRDHPQVDDQDLMLFETAVIEIAGNVVEHGRPEGRVTYTFELSVEPDHLRARLVDRGQEVQQALTPHAPAMPEELSESGRGLALARAALDRLEYRRDGGANIWEMRRDRR